MLPIVSESRKLGVSLSNDRWVRTVVVGSVCFGNPTQVRLAGHHDVV